MINKFKLCHDRNLTRRESSLITLEVGKDEKEDDDEEKDEYEKGQRIV